MNVQNTIALLEMFRGRNVAAVRTPSGVIFMGLQTYPKKRRSASSQSPKWNWTRRYGGSND